ncbi:MULTISPECIES: hypothetical protein [unclassified Streptomyces]|uniref:hypothetical protein n=1 Tax=unclassified Streptomyces TaxID=2593676 RepID=UPI002DD80A2D|nr:hypothetical protein [Streptomyces sp. NBC_01237]WRZ78258.1 hypothetical protein OG251_42605 [Streptomyces sp. NBC_01237]
MGDRASREHADQPLPRDPEDQLANDDDPLTVPVPAGLEEGTELPDTDEAGTGPVGSRNDGSVHPEHPIPDEPSG